VAGALRDTLFCSDHSFEFSSVCLAEAARDGAGGSAAASMVRAVELCAGLTEAETKAGLTGLKGTVDTRRTGDGEFAASWIFDLATVNVLTNADCGITVTPGGNRPLTSVMWVKFTFCVLMVTSLLVMGRLSLWRKTVLQGKAGTKTCPGASGNHPTRGDEPNDTKKWGLCIKVTSAGAKTGRAIKRPGAQRQELLIKTQRP
jgi:hypothetical protein